MQSFNKKIGILGGGQLGKMFCEAAHPWNVRTFVLDKDRNVPAAKVCHEFVEGDFKNKKDVIEFGKKCDLVIIEIESVSLEGLMALDEIGVPTFPHWKTLKIIQDKGTQNQFYIDHGIPTTNFKLFANKEEILEDIRTEKLKYPFVLKARKDGYDGRGVAVIQNDEMLHHAFDAPCVVEELIDIRKELALIVVRNTKGEISFFDPVEMVFDSQENLVKHLKCPASISANTAQQMRHISQKVAQQINLHGILAIEFFLSTKGHILVNEIAPRPHNSGHHTIEACYTSQYEQLLRCVLDLPFGSTQLLQPAVMLNLLGAPNHKGEAKIEGIELAMQTKGVYLHLYGKKETRPARKMGHITIINETLEDAERITKDLSDKVRIIT